VHRRYNRAKALDARLEACMKTVRQMLHGKAPLISIPPAATVYDALSLMATHDVGALVVLDKGRLVGMFSERDYARKVILKGRSSKDTPVSQIMTSPVVTVAPRDTIDQCMAVMTDKRIRHLPVVDEGRVVGVVSMGDLVKWIISDQDRTIDQLQGYISGKYPG
jgi:CBS domain-containing protein